jgi:hypothetical protein
MFSKLRGWLFNERLGRTRARPKLNMVSFSLLTPKGVMECEVNVDAYPEEEGRLQNFTGREDPTWALVEDYLREVPVSPGDPGRGPAPGDLSN